MLPKIKGVAFRVDMRGKTRLRQDDPKYASMMYALDENVGKVIDEVKKEGIYDNTVIFFTGDNGSLTTLEKRPGPTSALPFRGGKGWCYEGGIRVPFIVRDPASKIKGQVCNIPVVGTDLYSTIIDYAKGSDDLSTSAKNYFDSFDLRKVIFGEEKSVDRRTPLVWFYPHYHGSGWVPGTSIRVGDWVLIESYQDNSVKLYNLSKDIGEVKDLSEKYPEKRSELLNTLHQYLKNVNAVMPSLNPKYQKKHK